MQRSCSSSWGVVCVYWATTFKFCCQQRNFAAGISTPMFFREGSRPSLPPLLKLFCSLRYSVCLSCLNAPQIARKHKARSRPKKQLLPARAATRRVFPLALRPASKKSSRTRRHVMDECANAKGCRKRPCRQRARKSRPKCNTSTQAFRYIYI